jgi:hypothetical protein
VKRLLSWSKYDVADDAVHDVDDDPGKHRRSLIGLKNISADDLSFFGLWQM